MGQVEARRGKLADRLAWTDFVTARPQPGDLLFRFDNNTWDSIVCSELPFQTYVDVRWSVGRVLTSYTIAPGDVAIFAGSDPLRPFDLVMFIHEGRVVHDRVTGQVGEGRYVELLGRKYCGVR